MHNQDIQTRDQPLAEQAFRRLRHDVLSGALPAGAKLKIDELQERYALSSSPLREALSRLTQEGLVRADERRGFRVPAIALEDLADITRMRLMIDVSALREAIEIGDDLWESGIVAAFHRLERVEARLTDGPVILDDDWANLHRSFHLSLLSACTSERQKSWGVSLFDQSERYRRYSARFRKTSRRKSNEHQRILDAVLRRDAETACVLLQEHILGTQRNVEVALEASRPA